MNVAYCYLSIELDGELIGEHPLTQISKALKDMGERIAEFDESLCLDETIVIREGRKRIGQVDIHICEDPAEAMEGEE